MEQTEIKGEQNLMDDQAFREQFEQMSPRPDESDASFKNLNGL